MIVSSVLVLDRIVSFRRYNLHTGKFNANSLTYTESDDDSEHETTVFDKKSIMNGGGKLNGNANERFLCDEAKCL